MLLVSCFLLIPSALEGPPQASILLIESDGYWPHYGNMISCYPSGSIYKTVCLAAAVKPVRVLPAMMNAEEIPPQAMQHHVLEVGHR